jgi:hypothetical protein
VKLSGSVTMMKEVVVNYRIEVGSMVIEGLSYARLESGLSYTGMLPVVDGHATVFRSDDPRSHHVVC